MKTFLSRVALIASILSGASAFASEGGIAMDTWPSDRGHNPASLQNGARLFANYCIGCHGADLVRWNRLQEIGLTDAQIQQYLIFGNQKVGDTIRNPATRAEQKRWFGKTPPIVGDHARSHVCRPFRHRLHLHVTARLLPRLQFADRLEQRCLSEHRDAEYLWQEQGPREARIEFSEARKDQKRERCSM